MKKIYLFLFAFCVFQIANAQLNKKVSVLVNAKIDTNKKTIRLEWPIFSDAIKVDLYQKNFSTGNWDFNQSRNGNDSGFFEINNINENEVYEFQIKKMATNTKDYAYGYIYVSLNKQAVDHQGKMLLLIDSNLYAQIPESIHQYEMDLIGSGWKTEKEIISSNKKVTEIKDIIKSKKDLKTITIIGHVAVPYSGYLGFDGHTNHQGAWPADMYYAELDGTWTDNSVNVTPGGRPETDNIPGDGKFDQQGPTSPVDLEIARIDLTNLDAFSSSDSALHAYYFQKNHQYRYAGFNHEYKALVDDNFTGYEMTSWGFRSYAPIVDSNKVFYNLDDNNYDYRGTLKNNWWMLASASGAGSYTSCAGVINTSQFVTDSIKTVISGMSGSYFGDWDNKNNLLRAALASKPSIQNSFWGGIPAWLLHPLALGYNMGYCAKMTMNNYGQYQGNFNGGQGTIHIALMGDPSTNIYPVKSIGSISMSGNTHSPQVNWTASNDNNIVGYNVYRSDNIYGNFAKINTSLVNAMSFTDMNPLNGNNVYMVRAVKKIDNASGSHFQMSQGLWDSAQAINITSVAGIDNKINMLVYPNPTNHSIEIQISNDLNSAYLIELYSIDGKLLYKNETNQNNYNINLESFTTGIYFLKVYNNQFINTQKIIKE